MLDERGAAGDVTLESCSQLFVVVVWNFELYMLPLGLLLLLVWNYFFSSSSRDTSDMVSKQEKNTDHFLMNFIFQTVKRLLIPFSCCSRWRPCLNGKTMRRIKRTR